MMLGIFFAQLAYTMNSVIGLISNTARKRGRYTHSDFQVFFVRPPVGREDPDCLYLGCNAHSCHPLCGSRSSGGIHPDCLIPAKQECWIEMLKFAACWTQS